MIMSTSEQDAVRKLLLGETSEEEFLRAIARDSRGASARALEILTAGQAVKDPLAVEFGLQLAHRFGASEAYLDVLLSLAVEGWHTFHEDVVDLLSDFNTPLAVETLYRVALAESSHRDYDDTGGIARKCIWALSTIDAEDAAVRIGDLARSDNTYVRECALERLRAVSVEATTPSVRAAAQKLLSGPKT